MADTQVKRDSWRRMMKEGRFRAIRNLPVGWVLQILHSTDRAERWIRIGTEALLIGCLWFMLGSIGFLQDGSVRLWWVFVVVHSASWFFIGNFWVYMLDSFLWVNNPGIEGVLKYVDFVRRKFVNSELSDAILIYGSMCRGVFHGRSDLDLRIIRKPGVLAGLRAVFMGFAVRVPAAIKKIPVDLQVVDSFEFLKEQMRPDERPIIVFLRPGLKIDNPGMDYEQVIADPSQVLRVKPGKISSSS